MVKETQTPTPKHPYEAPHFVEACNDAYHLAGLLKLILGEAEDHNDWRLPVLHLAYDISNRLSEKMIDFNLEGTMARDKPMVRATA